ncbi:MAG: hypothetical protein QXX12_04700 [Nanopusillaceae archaeon]
MCVIAFVRTGVVFREDHARRMWEANSHGSGFAYHEAGQWKFLKGFMTLEELLKALKERGLLGVEEHPPFAIHFRIATHGGVTPELTHPFEVGIREGRAVLFHNGTLSLPVEKGLSDTAQFAKFLTELGLNKEQLKLLLKEGGILEEVRNKSRLCVLFPEEEEPFLVGRWTEVDGLMVSNESWVYPRISYGYKSSYSFDHLYSYGYSHSYSDYFGVFDDAPSCSSCKEEELPSAQIGRWKFYVTDDELICDEISPQYEKPEGKFYPYRGDVYYLLKGEFYKLLGVEPLEEYLPELELGDSFYLLDREGQAFLGKVTKKGIIYFPVKGGRKIYADLVLYVDKVLKGQGTIK